MRGAAFFAYADNYLIDVKFGVIMDVEASRALRQAEVRASKTMIERTEERFDIKREWLAADTAYGSGANLDWLVNDKKIAPHVPVIEKSNRDDGTFNREDFTFDKERTIWPWLPPLAAGGCNLFHDCFHRLSGTNKVFSGPPAVKRGRRGNGTYYSSDIRPKACDKAQLRSRPHHARVPSRSFESPARPAPQTACRAAPHRG